MALAYLLCLGTWMGIGMLWSTISLPTPIHPGQWKSYFHEQNLTQLFCVLGCLLPLALGLTLAQAFHEPFHCPFGMVLPRARLRFLVCHGCIAVLVALAVAAGAHELRPLAPMSALFGLAIAAVSLWVPYEPGFRWQGSRLAFFVLCALLVFSSFHSAQLPDFLGANSLLVCATGVAVALLCFSLGYSRERLRRRALTPWTTLYGALGTRAGFAHMHKESQAHWPFRLRGSGKAKWSGPTDGSIGSWTRLIRYSQAERAPLGDGRLFFLAPLVMFVAFGLVGYFLPGAAPYRGYSPEKQLLEQQRTAIQSVFSMIPGVMGIIATMRVPGMKIFYPISRRELFRVARRLSLAGEAMLLVTLISAILGNRLGVVLAGGYNNHALFVMLQVAMLFALPLIPVLQLAGAYRSTNKLVSAIVIYALSFAYFLAFNGMIISSDPFRAAVLSMEGTIIVGGIALALHFVYYGIIRTFFLNDDLVART